jgi:hypothetical protein
MDILLPPVLHFPPASTPADLARKNHPRFEVYSTAPVEKLPVDRSGSR